MDGLGPDMLKNIGPAAVRWLQAFCDYVMAIAIPKIWRALNVITILKPGNPLDEPTGYARSHCYVVASNTCDQLFAPASCIESWFQNKLKTGAG